MIRRINKKIKTPEKQSQMGIQLETPKFNEQLLRRQIILDRLIRMVAFTGILGAFFWFTLFSTTILPVSNVIMIVLLMMGWFAINSINARTGRELGQVSSVIDQDPERVEKWIALALARRPLVRWVRLMIYHRLAMVRHRERNFAEAAAISRIVLGYPLGPAEGSRAHLLLLLTESSLEIHDIQTAYSSLSRLYSMPVSLTEALQRLSLQIRYELLTGNYDSAISNLDEKLEMVELLPAPQCGVTHQLLAIAANRCGNHDLAEWLQKRANLLCKPEWLQAYDNVSPQ